MDKKLSTKISILSFFLLLFVVVIHCYNIEYNNSGNNEVWFIENLISNGYLEFVVPTFFFISGYLFFLSFDLNNNNKLLFKSKLFKRLKTLGVPYLFWCTFWFLFIYLLQIIPLLKSYFSSPLHEMNLFNQFSNLILEPINYQFWFIRELLLYFLISPLIFILLKYFKYYFLPIIFLLASFKTSIFTIAEIDIFKYGMIVYFIFGAYCSLYKVNLTLKLNKYLALLLLLLWISISTIAKYYELFIVNDWKIILLSDVGALLGCIAIWSLYDIIEDKIQFKSHEVFSYGFFIYATHGIPLLLLKKVETAFFILDDKKLFILYFINFLITTVFIILIAKFLKKTFPKFYFFTTGNR
ncbi:acyltransferase family protein [Flavivirga rizhaonensis]|uniref:Acyltransferase 3 domain-containing protein n=1 Tax=Flavivirga rizhaonensis TaxID=2559571 RepID=A0A4S1E0W2_9FLAO|nr:acyltransferase [Flavivirga rizhaonensis]TGV03953.1 hypothetical protein EM932_03935 [Flavivirga rizhaonensis]